MYILRYRQHFSNHLSQCDKSWAMPHGIGQRLRQTNTFTHVEGKKPENVISLPRKGLEYCEMLSPHWKIAMNHISVACPVWTGEDRQMTRENFEWQMPCLCMNGKELPKVIVLSRVWRTPPPREPEVFDGGRKAFVYHSARRSQLCNFLCQNRRKDPPSWNSAFLVLLTSC